MTDTNNQDLPHRIAMDARLHEPAKELAAGCDPDFDDGYEELEREFHDLCNFVTFE